MGMKHWHIRALIALAAAMVCMSIGWISGGQGWRTIQMFGSEFGFARIKSSTFIVLWGQLFRFPLDWIFSLAALIAIGIAIATAWNHSLQNNNPIKTLRRGRIGIVDRDGAGSGDDGGAKD